MPLVKLLVPHYNHEGRYVPAGTTVNLAIKDLSPWMVPAEASAKTEMDKRFNYNSRVGEYKRGTL